MQLSHWFQVALTVTGVGLAAAAPHLPPAWQGYALALSCASVAVLGALGLNTPAAKIGGGA